MSEFVRAGRRLINLDRVVEIRVTEAITETRYDEYGEPVFPRPLSVEVVTTATTSSFDDGGDFPEFKHTDFHPHVVRFVGEEAEDLLSRVYVPSAHSVNSYRAPALVEFSEGMVGR